jgi:transcriptional regulator with XRE-family HTH domain
LSRENKIWSNSPKSVPAIHPRRKYSVKLAAALRACRSILGISQAAFAREIGISKSKLARAETAAGSISSEDLEYALSFFRHAGIDVNLTIDGDLRITVPDGELKTIDVLMTTHTQGTVPVDEIIDDIDEAGHITTKPEDDDAN